MLKRMLLCVGTAMVLAMLSPAAASATWFMEGKAITKNEQLQLQGQFNYEGEVGGGVCKFVQVITLQAGTTQGQAQWAIDGAPTSACSTQGLIALVGCKMEAIQVTGTTDVHKVAQHTFAVTRGSLHVTTVKADGQPCTPASCTVDAGAYHVSVAPDGTSAALSGKMQSSIGELEISGSGSITPAKTFEL